LSASDSVRAVVQTVVDEIYGGLWAPPPLPVEEENWHSSWVAREAKIGGSLGHSPMRDFQ
jgi:hypothetical protein